MKARFSLTRMRILTCALLVSGLAIFSAPQSKADMERRPLLADEIRSADYTVLARCTKVEMREDPSVADTDGRELRELCSFESAASRILKNGFGTAPAATFEIVEILRQRKKDPPPEAIEKSLVYSTFDCVSFVRYRACYKPPIGEVWVFCLNKIPGTDKWGSAGASTKALNMANLRAYCKLNDKEQTSRRGTLAPVAVQ